jgi:hypothetical protein
MTRRIDWAELTGDRKPGVLSKAAVARKQVAEVGVTEPISIPSGTKLLRPWFWPGVVTSEELTSSSAMSVPVFASEYGLERRNQFSGKVSLR